MRYWDEMNDKYGFGDGGAVPDDARVRREAYVRTINGLAEIRGSGQRVVGFDRGGFHNPCMVFMVDKDQLSLVPLKGGTPVAGSLQELGIFDEAVPDDIMEGIIDGLLFDGSADDAVAGAEAKLDTGIIWKIVEADRERLGKKGKGKGKGKGKAGKG